MEVRSRDLGARRGANTVAGRPRAGMGILRHEDTKRFSARDRQRRGEHGQLAQEGVVRGGKNIHQKLSSVRTLAKPVLQHDHRARASWRRSDRPSLGARRKGVPSELQQGFRKAHARAGKGDLLDGEAERGGREGKLARAHRDQDLATLPRDRVVATMGKLPRQSSEARPGTGELQAPDSTGAAPKAPHGRHASEEWLQVRQQELLEGRDPCRPDSSLAHEEGERMRLGREVANRLLRHAGRG